MKKNTHKFNFVSKPVRIRLLNDFDLICADNCYKFFSFSHFCKPWSSLSHCPVFSILLSNFCLVFEKILTYFIVIYEQIFKSIILKNMA